MNQVQSFNLDHFSFVLLVRSYSTPLGLARQFIETCSTYNLLCGK
jgi:hypothetical protein